MHWENSNCFYKTAAISSSWWSWIWKSHFCFTAVALISISKCKTSDVPRLSVAAWPSAIQNSVDWGISIFYLFLIILFSQDEFSFSIWNPFSGSLSLSLRKLKNPTVFILCNFPHIFTLYFFLFRNLCSPFPFVGDWKLPAQFSNLNTLLTFNLFWYHLPQKST